MLCLIALQTSPVVAQSLPPRYSSGCSDVVAIAGGGAVAGAALGADVGRLTVRLHPTVP